MQWELGKAEPRARKVPRINAFLGYTPEIDRYDVGGMIE
jgi:hypothetical protein